MLGLGMFILAEKSLLRQFNIKVDSEEILRLGKFNLANKGVIFSEICLDMQSFGFFNCHLTSGTREIDNQKRIENLKLV